MNGLPASPHLPPFVPHPWLRGGHLQTLAGTFFPSGPSPPPAVRRLVALDDGDTIVLHDNCPPKWRPADRVALLIHGLAGSHDSGYMRRIAARLTERNVRAFRMDLRGCGAGASLARRPYHGGRSEDAAAALRTMAELCPQAPATLIGFSLGGNIALKLLGELGSSRCGGLERAVAVSAPVDFEACSRQLSRRAGGWYDRHFVSLLLSQLRRHQHLAAEAETLLSGRSPRRLREFDDWYTAPACGFGGVEDYYRQASSLALLSKIAWPTLIINSRDDPLAPAEPLEMAQLGKAVTLCLTPSGGHLGFIARRGGDPDFRWLDWRIVDWTTNG